MTILDEAKAAIPGHDEAAAAIVKFRALRAELNNTAAPADPFDTVLDDLLAGGPVDVDRLVDDLAAHATRNLARQGLGPGILVLRQRLDAHREQTIRDGVDAGLAVVRTHLADFAPTVADLDKKLGPVTTPEGALRAKVGDDWLAAEHAVDTYDEIRGAQMALCRTAGTDGRTVNLSLDRNAGAHHPYWKRRHLAHHPDLLETVPHDGDGRPVIGAGDWPEPLDDLGDAVDAWRWPTHDRVAYLRWLFRPSSPAEPWIPDFRQMLDHVAALERGEPTEPTDVGHVNAEARTRFKKALIAR